MKTNAFIGAMAVLVLVIMVTIAAKHRRQDDWCPAFAASVDMSDYVNQRTGRIEWDSARGAVYYPGTSHIALDREEIQCIRREAENSLQAYQNGG